MNEFNNFFYNYLNSQKPICREERQFALFLYNKLDSLKNSPDNILTKEKNLLKVCGLELATEIKQVAFEAAYLRDLKYTAREQDKNLNTQNKRVKENGLESEFNNIICRAVLNSDIMKRVRKTIENSSFYSEFRKYKFESKECDNCLNKLNDEEAKVYKLFLRYIRALMHVKPDIAVVYKTDNTIEEHIKFIECKYMSYEGKYNFGAKCDYLQSKFEHLQQTDLQKMVLNILCGESSLLGENYIADINIPLVIFESEKNKNRKFVKESKNKIAIDKLF